MVMVTQHYEPGILQARTLEYGHMQQPLSQKVSLQNFPVTVFIVIGFGNSCITFSGSQLMKVVVPFSQKLTMTNQGCG